MHFFIYDTPQIVNLTAEFTFKAICVYILSFSIPWQSTLIIYHNQNKI